MSKSEIMKQFAAENGLEVVDLPLAEDAKAALENFLVNNPLPVNNSRKRKDGKYKPRNSYKWHNTSHPSWVKYRHMKKAYYNMARGAKQSNFQRSLAKESMFIV